MKHFLKYNVLFFFFGCLFVQSSFSQFNIPEKPSFQTSVYDYIDLLSGDQKRVLEDKLIKYSDTTSTQIVVAIISSAKGEDIGYLATNWAQKWGVGGSEEEDNGVFMLLAKDDRKITIRTGYGTEHLLTDYTSRQIIEYDILPHFKRGDFYGGLDAGTNAIFRVMNGEYQGTRQRDNGFDPSFLILIIIIIIFFIIISRGNRGNRGGRRNYRNTDSRDILETIILSNAGRGGFGGGTFGGGSSGGFGGGGFGGGFGGGGFGGGGATGGW